MSDPLDLFAGQRLVDLSPPIYTNMPNWPAHPGVGIVDDARNYPQNGYYAQTLVLSEHSASHVDAPSHSHEDLLDATIDTYPLEKFTGPARRIDLSGYGLGAGECATVAQLREQLAAQDQELAAGDFVLFYFGCSPYEKPYAEREHWERNAPGLDEDACRLLAEAGVAGVGSDTLACDIAVRDGEIVSAHGHDTYFLPRHILIYEGLINLAEVSPDSYFIAAPLRVRKGSGAPFRGIAVCPQPAEEATS
jgi:kynurenine formamidase